MNEHLSPADRDRLIADAYHGDWTSGPASALASRAARTVRRRRAIRRFMATAATVALLTGSAWWLSAPPRPIVRGAAATRSYEIISDAELKSCLQNLQDQSAIIFPDAEGRAQVVLLIGG